MTGVTKMTDTAIYKLDLLIWRIYKFLIENHFEFFHFYSFPFVPHDSIFEQIACSKSMDC